MPWERLATAIIGLPVAGLSPIAGPGPIAQLAGIARGTYTEIVEIIAPSEAAYGDLVNVEVKVRNIWIDSFYIAVTGRYDGVDVFFSPDYANVGPGATYSFTSSFTMPNKDVRLQVQSFFWLEPEWYQDDYDYVDIALAAAVWQMLATRTVTLTPIGWQMLAEAQVTITPIGWQMLASRTVTITPIPVEWVKLASETVQIAPIAVEWQKLASKTVTIVPEEVPWELVYQHKYPRGETYVGKAEECTATLTIPLPDQIFPNSWVIEKIADTFADEVAKEGGEMLDIKIYEDATPTWHTDYKIVATAITSPFPWAVVILLILAIILVVAFIKLVIEFKDIDWGEIPAPIPWAILALAGGLGILGVGAAFALAGRRSPSGHSSNPVSSATAVRVSSNPQYLPQAEDAAYEARRKTVVNELANWFATHRREILAVELHPIIKKHFPTEKEQIRFIQYLSRPEAQDAIKRQLRTSRG